MLGMDDKRPAECYMSSCQLSLHKWLKFNLNVEKDPCRQPAELRNCILKLVNDTDSS